MLCGQMTGLQAQLDSRMVEHGCRILSLSSMYCSCHELSMKGILGSIVNHFKLAMCALILVKNSMLNPLSTNSLTCVICLSSSVVYKKTANSFR